MQYWASENYFYSVLRAKRIVRCGGRESAILSCQQIPWFVATLLSLTRRSLHRLERKGCKGVTDINIASLLLPDSCLRCNYVLLINYLWVIITSQYCVHYSPITETLHVSRTGTHLLFIYIFLFSCG